MPRLILAIETSNPSAWREGQPRPGVAVGEMGGMGESRVIGAADLETSNPQHDDLMTCIQRAMTIANAAPRDLGRVAVSIGPGGFTNVRIAITTARMIAEVTGAACVPVASAQVVSRRVTARPPYAVALASKGETAHVTCFSEAWHPIGPASIMSAGDVPALAAQGFKSLVADHHLPPSMREAAMRAAMTIIEPTFDPVACLEAGLELPPSDPVALAPLYPREPEAVTKWRALRK